MTTVRQRMKDVAEENKAARSQNASVWVTVLLGVAGHEGTVEGKAGRSLGWLRTAGHQLPELHGGGVRSALSPRRPRGCPVPFAPPGRRQDDGSLC